MVLHKMKDRWFKTYQTNKYGSSHGFSYIEALIATLLLTILTIPTIFAFYSIYNIQALTQQNYTKALLTSGLHARLENNIANNPHMINSPIHQIIGETPENFAVLYQTHIFSYSVEFYVENHIWDSPAQPCILPQEPVYISENYTLNLSCIQTGYIDLTVISETPNTIISVYIHPNMTNNISLHLEGYPSTLLLLPIRTQTSQIHTRLTAQDPQGRILQIGVLP